MLDIKEVVKGLQIERECVSRDCDRDCGKCDLVQERDWLLSVYDDAIALLKEQENLAKCVDQEHQVNEYLNRQLAERPEIIRCKDCKRYYANGGACDQVLSEWFCADGERKEE